MKRLKQLSTNFHTATVNLKHGARCRKHDSEQLKTEVNTLTRSNKGWQGDIVCISEGGGDTRLSRAASKTHSVSLDMSTNPYSSKKKKAHHVIL